MVLTLITLQPGASPPAASIGAPVSGSDPGLLPLLLAAAALAALAVVASVAIRRAVRGRRLRAEALRRVLEEVEAALADPILIHQARRLLRRRDSWNV